MSRHHQGSRRRSYGRREHELHERNERGRDLIDITDDTASRSVVANWRPGLSPRTFQPRWLPLRGAD
jgi:hypothetical protein